MAQLVRGVVARSKGAPVEVTTVLVPDPGPGEALVGVKACGVCHSDLHYREGAIAPDFPFLLGHEAAGVVEAVGPGATDLSPAVGIGALAELCLVDAGQAVKVDPAARPEAAGLVGCGVMTGFGAAVYTGNVQRGDTVAVFGCGGVGDAAIAGAALAGARRVIAVDVNARKLEW